MKKRQILMVLLALTLALSLVLYGCDTEGDVSNTSSEAVSEDSTASKTSSEESTESQAETAEFDFDSFSNAIKNTLELDSIDFDGEVSFGYSLSGIEMNVNNTYEVLIANDGENIVASVNETTEMAGMEIEASSYYADGYLYTLSGEEKIKSAFSYDEFYGEYMPIEEMGEDVIDSYSSENIDGVDYHTIVLDKENLSGLGLFEDIDELMSMVGTEDFSISIDTAEIVTSYDENYINYYEINLVLTVTAEDEEMGSIEMPVELSGFVNINNPGEDVEVTAPEDLDEYIEVDEAY